MEKYVWRILLIDDDREEYLITRQMLSQARQDKFLLEWASSYENGRSILREDQFDTVLVDYDLGLHNGIELIREARQEDGYASPMILLTGHGSYEIDMEAMQAGAVDYLNKNEINAAFLERSIRYGIDRNRSEAALEEANRGLERHKQELLDSHQRLELAQEAAGMGVWEWNMAQPYATGSEAYFNMHQWNRPPDGRFEIRALADRIHPEDRQKVEEAALRAMRGEPYNDNEFRIILPDGQVRWMESFSKVILEDGKPARIIGATQDITERKRMEEQRLEFTTEVEVQRRLLEYREKERQVIARDLHDGPIQTLVSTMFNIQYAKETIESQAIRLELEQVSHNIKDAVHELRQLMNELRPPALLRFGLARTLRLYAEDFSERHPGLEIELNLLDDDHIHNDEVSLMLFRICQEALNNIARHSRASQVTISYSHDPQFIQIEIRDNGVGFQVPADLIAQTQDGHFGLAGMKERAQAINGRLSISSSEEGGTVITVRVPCSEYAAA